MIRVKSKDTLYIFLPDTTENVLERLGKLDKGNTIICNKTPIIVVKEND